MHKQHVAHRYELFFCASSTYEFFSARDISILNVMMDGSMYPDSWHPCDGDQMRDNFLGPRDESFGAVRDFGHLFTTIKYTLKGIPPVPTNQTSSQAKGLYGE
jgi:hypothetical protein